MVDAIGSDDPRIQSGRFTFPFIIGREDPWGASSETGPMAGFFVFSDKVPLITKLSTMPGGQAMNGWMCP